MSPISRTSAILAAVLLSACGGGNGGSTAAGTPTSTAPTGTMPTATTPVTTTPDTSTPATTLQPLQGGSLYAGTVSFGDTLTLQLDAPAAGQITLRFVDSRFGLGGALVARYTVQTDGSLLATGFADVTGAGTPAALATAASGLTLRFTRENGLLSGSLSGVPNLAAADGSLLQGAIAAANTGATTLAQLAGTYSFLRQVTGYTARGVAQSKAELQSGQMKIQPDGSLRVCVGQPYADSCVSADGSALTGKVAAETDQTAFPGALRLSLNGQDSGRLMASVVDGKGQTLLVDHVARNGDGSIQTGTWTLQAATAVAASALDGEWLCAQPAPDATGRTQRHYLSFGGTTLQTDTIDTDVTLNYNASFATSTGGATAVVGNVPGLIAGQWTVEGSGTQPARTFLPLGSHTLHFTGSMDSANFAGTCARLPAPTPLATYLSATAGSKVDIRLGDAHPTQPAIGYDQVYYKMARYRNTANGSTQWKKEFDDYCEATGLADGAKGSTVIAGTSLLKNPASFTCSTKVAYDAATLKTAVVGPNGTLYLTDGHHTFTSFWNAPDGGGADVKVPVIMKGNYSTDTNAAFWRRMRANKLVWLTLPNGNLITPADLPTQLGLENGLLDDPYRALLYFTRDVGYTPPANAPEYLEFYWANWLRSSPQNFSLNGYTLTSEASYLQAIQAASNLMIATPNATPIDASGKTALEMGKLSTFGTSAFADLNTAITAAKPGKLAYAMSYRAALAAAARP